MICYHTKSTFERRPASPFNPPFRPALSCIYGPLDYREQRALLQRIDEILTVSGLEEDFINLALTDWKINTDALSFERFARLSVLAFCSNIARSLTGLSHRDFCTRLADSPHL